MNSTNTYAGGEILTTAPLLKGLMVRNGDPRRTAYPPNLEVQWKNSQPTADGPVVTNDLLAAAIASTKPFRMRPLAGMFAPDWLKARVGTFVYVEPQSGTHVPDMPCFWKPAFSVAYAAWIAKLAALYDGKVSSVFIDGCMTYYAEVCQRGLQSVETRNNLAAAGFTAAADDIALRASINAHSAFKISRAACAFNPYQRLNANGSWSSDEAYTRTLMAYMRTVHPTSIVQNDSIRDTYIGQETRRNSLYHDMVVLGKPLSFQTAVMKRVGNLYDVVQWAISMGACVVELPQGYGSSLTSAHLAELDAALKAN